MVPSPIFLAPEVEVQNIGQNRYIFVRQISHISSHAVGLNFIGPKLCCWDFLLDTVVKIHSWVCQEFSMKVKVRRPEAGVLSPKSHILLSTQHVFRVLCLLIE